MKVIVKVDYEGHDSSESHSGQIVLLILMHFVCSLQRRNRGRPVGSGGRADNIRRPLWMKKLQALDSPMSRISARRIKKPSRFLEDSADSENDSDAVNVPRGTVLESADMRWVGARSDMWGGGGGGDQGGVVGRGSRVVIDLHVFCCHSSDLGDDADFGADEFEDDDADFDINNDDYETPKKRGRPSTADSPAAKKLKTPASKIAVSIVNGRVV